MSVEVNNLLATLCPPLPKDIVEFAVLEYTSIKKHLVLGRYSPTELNGGRFAECIIRLLQHLQGEPVTPFGQQLRDTDRLFRDVSANVQLHESIRFFIPPLVKVILNVRNRRDVAHAGGDVSPNYSDSLLVSQTADWVLTEIVRIYYNCSIVEAKKIVEGINQVHIPVVFNHNGFLKVQNSLLLAKEKVLLLLYYRNPEITQVADLQKWIRYQNGTTFANQQPAC